MVKARPHNSDMHSGEEVPGTTPRLSRPQERGLAVQLIQSIKSRRDEDEGFTLIELMVVVLIIAILIAIAIPTFLGARQRAQDRAAQSDIRNGLTAEKTFYTDVESYSAVTASMKAIEPSLQWGTKTIVTVGDVTAGDGNVVCLEQKSKSNKMFALADVATGSSAGTYYNSDASGASICSTTVATVAGWKTTGW